MLKYLFTTLITAAITIVTTLVAVDFQRERLVYELSDPERLGQFNYRKLRVTNRGWQPATNIKVYLANSTLKPNEVQATPPFDLTTTAPWVIGGFERLRRDESVTINFTYDDTTAFDTAGLSVKSDESIATAAGAVDAGASMASLLPEFIAKATGKPAGSATPCPPK